MGETVTHAGRKINDRDRRYKHFSTFPRDARPATAPTLLPDPPPMPKEIRYLLFSAQEVQTAVIEFYRKRRGGAAAAVPARRTAAAMEPGLAIELCQRADGEPFALLRVGPPGGGGRDAAAAIELAAPDLVSALILYCKDKRIPIPAGGYKSLEIVGDELGLLATLRVPQGARPRLLAAVCPTAAGLLTD